MKKYSIITRSEDNGFDEGIDYNTMNEAKRAAKELLNEGYYETIFITTAWYNNPAPQAVLWAYDRDSHTPRRPYRCEIESMISPDCLEEYLKNSPYYGKC